MWKKKKKKKKKKKIQIIHTPLKSPPGALDDLVEYSPIDGHKYKSVCGIDTPDPARHAMDSWKGRGLLKIASSHWEVLGYGDDEGGWIVTFSAQSPTFVVASSNVLPWFL